jgi:PhnB protein
MSAKPIPDGYRSVTPSLAFKNTQAAIDFYKKAFGATVVDSFANPMGRGIMHAVMKIGDSFVMLGDEMPQSQSAESMGGSPISMYIYVTDVDAAFEKAVSAGATVVYPVGEMFWGDRAGNLKDPFGYQWMIGTHKRDMSKDEIKKEALEFFARMSAQK